MNRHGRKIPPDLNKSLPQPPTSSPPPPGIQTSSPRKSTYLSSSSSTMPPHNSLITEEVKESYYKEIINSEFRNLQLDPEISKKSLFDLMDYCELLYEESKEELHTSSNRHALDNIKSYLKGYLIFNYFINSFIMLHFSGFDKFIESNEADFLIYLNIFDFYNVDKQFRNGNYSTDTNSLRLYVKSYLVKKNLLSFNLDELYEWLHEYIIYFKEKENSKQDDEEEEDDSSSFSFIDEVYATPDLPQSSTMSHSRNSSIASENEFKLRYPSINQQIPPVPEEVPQSPPTSISYLRTSLRDSTIEPSVSPPSSHAPSPPVHRYSQVYDYSPSPGPQFDSPYPVIDKTLNEKSPSPDENLYLRPKSYGRPKKEVPDGYLRPTDYTTARIHQSNDVPHNNTYHKNPNYQTYTTTAPPPGPPPQPYQPPVVYPSPPSQSIPIAVPNQLYVDPTMYANSGYQQQQQQPQPYQPHPPPHQQMRSVYHVQHPQQVAQYANNQYTHVPPPNFQQQQQQQHHAMKKHKYEKQKEYSVCGLKNFGSSCYINSTIQLLFGVYAFRNIFDHGYQKYIKDPRYLKMLSKLSGGSKNSLLLSDAISGLLRTFQNNGGVPVSPSKFIRITASLKPDLNIPYEQQDAQEFLMFVLDRLHEELAEKKHDDYDPEEAIRRWKISIDFDDKEQYLKWCKSLHEHEGISPITDLFQGHLRNKLKCNKCGYESINYSSFSILSLPIPSNHSHEMVDLTQCLRYYIQDEVLSGDNAWHCPKCNGEVPTLNNHPVFESKRSGIFKLGGRKKQQQQQQQKTSKSDPTSSTISIKSLMFVKLPTILFIHLSRFSMFNLTDKLNTRIRYPFVLKFNNHGHEISYKLSGIINHFGNLKSGHYTALINKSNVHEKAKNLDNLINPYWCLFDDDNVTCNIASGNRDPQLNDSVSSDVYVLCYERIDL